jgi:hypothetical protein
MRSGIVVIGAAALALGALTTGCSSQAVSADAPAATADAVVEGVVSQNQEAFTSLCDLYNSDGGSERMAELLDERRFPAADDAGINKDEFDKAFMARLAAEC